MRKHKLIGLCLLLCDVFLFFSACHFFPTAEMGKRTIALKGETKLFYRSAITKKDCLLCGDGDGTPFSPYWGQDNIGIVSLNTFEVFQIEINRYDDEGRLIKKPARSTSIQMNSLEEDGFSLQCYVDSDRGLGKGTISFHRDEKLDLQKFAQFLCTDCLNTTMQNVSPNDCLGVAVVYFKTRELYPLEKYVTGFLREDFYFLCDLRERQNEDTGMEIDFHVFYCPERYE